MTAGLTWVTVVIVRRNGGKHQERGDERAGERIERRIERRIGGKDARRGGAGRHGSDFEWGQGIPYDTLPFSPAPFH